MSTLSGKTFVLELGREIRFKAKQDIIAYLREQQAYVSYTLTGSADYVLVTNDVDTYKTRRAKQLGIPLVDVEYVHQCRRLSPGEAPVVIGKFIMMSAEDKDNFTKSGTITVAGTVDSSLGMIKSAKFDLAKIKFWNSDDIELPRFDELTHGEIGKWAIFKETNDNSDVFFALELQIIPEQYYDRTRNDFRMRFRYEKQTITSQKEQIKNTLVQYAFTDNCNELQQLFALYYHRVATMPRVTRIREMLPDKLGSKLLLRSLFTHRIDTQILDDDVCQLVESLWIESIGDLNRMLSVPPESIALKTIIAAEVALLEFRSNNDPVVAQCFYSLIPHRPQFVVNLINDRRALTDKIDLCQMLRDLVTVNELTNWNVKASIEAKYRALKCHIATVQSTTPEYETVADLIDSSMDKTEQVFVHRVFSVAKQTDAVNFNATLFNQRQLFHGSKYNNFLGILSRGLVMPKMVVNELGIVRTDSGCLGYGLYFSDSASTSLKYTTASTTRPDRRLLCICQVALGNSAKYYSFSDNLTRPPDGFHSVHGVKKTDDNNSMFTDNEYTIYQLDQQRILYLVEVSCQRHNCMNIALEQLPIVHDQHHALKAIENAEVSPSTIDDEPIQVAEQDYGLVCPSSGKLIPLKSFHVRAQLVDVAVEVVLYQIYHNTSSTSIEAKYVFPLDENSAVCGFEAHINNKVIKGIVKEKEQAKREYREAIEKGHGAYLMQQEQPEVFSVAVGNLPANTEVIIKITYVAELQIENNDIIFRLPAKVASWQSKQAIEAKDQTILPSIGLVSEKVEFSFKASIRMPYDITKLFSPTHRIRRKLTDCLAMIELIDNVLLEQDFVLAITLKSVNLPRMSNEILALPNDDATTIANRDSQACMLTFYPRFDILTNHSEYVEIIFVIDVSNSMNGKYAQQAKQLAHLFLTNINVDERNLHFNVITFGSDNDECFPMSLPNTKENIDKAKHFVLHSLEHRGNTDLFTVLRQYSLFPSSSKHGRQFVLISDGHVNDLQSILALVEHNPNMCHDRMFTCSIGDVANKHALKQLASSTNGGGLMTIFDSNYRSRWKTKVISILEHTRQPCIKRISIDWHGQSNNEERFNTQAPRMIRSLFNGMRLTVYRFIRNCHKATLTATIDGQTFDTTVFSSQMTTTKGRILHCLTARAIIDDFDKGLLHTDESENELIKTRYKKDIIDLSIEHSVVSTYTSFVAIEERDEKDRQPFQPGVRLVDVMLDRDIDLLPYIGWDGDKSQVTSIRDKLMEARRALESASIQSKLAMMSTIERLCEKISYRSGGDAKFDMMQLLINTYRYTLKEPEEANKLDEKMRKDLMNELKNATWEEQQLLRKLCDDINLDIDASESDSESSSTQSDSISSNFDLSLLDCMDEQSYVAVTKKLAAKWEKREALRDAQWKIEDDMHMFNDEDQSGRLQANEPEKPFLANIRRSRSSSRWGSLADYEEFSDVAECDMDFIASPPKSYCHASLAADSVPVECFNTNQHMILSSNDEISGGQYNDVPMMESHRVEIFPDNKDALKNLLSEITVGNLLDEMNQLTTSASVLETPISQQQAHVQQQQEQQIVKSPTAYDMPPLLPSSLSQPLHQSPGSSAAASSMPRARKSTLTAQEPRQKRVEDKSESPSRQSESDYFEWESMGRTQEHAHYPMGSGDDEHDHDIGDRIMVLSVEQKKCLQQKKSKSEGISSMIINPIKSPCLSELLLLDVVPLGFGIGDVKGNMYTLIRRNTTIPTRTQLCPVFTNARAYQTTATIRVFEGEHKLTQYNTFLGEFTLSGLTLNYAARTLEIAIRMDIDANGILHVDAEEARSGATASITIVNESRLSREDIERHIAYVERDNAFSVQSVYDRNLDDPLCLLDGQISMWTQNFSGEHITSSASRSGGPFLAKLNDIRLTESMIEELKRIQSENGSFMLNEDLADVLHIKAHVFDEVEQYLSRQGLNSLALNIRDEIRHLIGTGIILIWLLLQVPAAHRSTSKFPFKSQQIAVLLRQHLPESMIERVDKAIVFYEKTYWYNRVYCWQLEFSNISWDMFIQHSLFGLDIISD